VAEPTPRGLPAEMRPYLRRLLLSILFGIVVMASVATWAWRTYGVRLEESAPLPPGKPPINGVPVKQ
jgi:hypothetical protein